MDTIVGGVHQVSLGYVNSFVIDGDDGVCLVDTLLPRKEGVIAEALNEIGRSLEEVTAVFLTHSHTDHSGGTAAIRAESRAVVYAGKGDAPAIRGEERPPPPPVPPYLTPLRWLIAAYPGPPPAGVDHFVDEAGGVRLPADLRVVDTPGHTPGHRSYLLDRHGGVLFVGDAARASRRGKVSRGFFNRATPAVDASVRRIADLEFDIALFGHASPLRSGASAAFRRFVESLDEPPPRYRGRHQGTSGRE